MLLRDEAQDMPTRKTENPPQVVENEQTDRQQPPTMVGELVASCIRLQKFHTRNQLTTLNMIMNNQFGGLSSEDPNNHIKRFIRICAIIAIERTLNA